MAINTSQVYPITAIVTPATISVANTHLDGTGTIVDFLVAGANMSRVTHLVITALVTTTGGDIVRIFLKKTGTYYLFEEIEVPEFTPSAVRKAWQGFSKLISRANPLEIPNGITLGASTQKGYSYTVNAKADDF